MRSLTIQRVMLIVLFVMLFSLAVRVPVDTDTWWHIRSGEYTLKEGMIYKDPFSHTKQGEEWINHSWGSQILLYSVWEIAGSVGLALYTASLATAGMAVLYLLCKGNVYVRAFVLVLGASTAAVFWSPRPQMISFFFSTVVLYLLYTYREDHPPIKIANFAFNRVWLLIPLMMIWGNMHAGFSIGYIFIGGFIFGETLNTLLNRGGENVMPISKIRILVIVSIISVAALVINPYGLKMLLVPFQTVSIGALREYIQEWNSPNFQERQTWPFIFMLLALFAAAGTSNKHLRWTDFILISGTTFMALTAGRNIAVFAVVATPALTFYLDAILQVRGWSFQPMQRVTRQQARLNLLLLILIVSGGLFNILAVLNPTTIDKAQREFLPVQLVEFIKAEGLTGPMFNSYNWGGYLVFALPEEPVYVDGRTDLYKDEFLLRYLRTVLASDDWRSVLDEDKINMVVIEKNSGLAKQLAEEPDWTLVYPNEAYPDEKRVIYVRNNN